MGCVLITGASGLIGRALSEDLARRGRDVLCMSRRDPGNGLPFVRGDFAREADRRRLDAYPVEAVAHLGAVTGGCTERDGILVNVEGTRGLLAYALERGVRRAVLASSIAAVGLEDPAFRPRALPVRDDHPCLDRHGYGLSKYLMEEVMRYFGRKHPAADLVALRLGAVPPPDRMPPRRTPGEPPGRWALASLSVLPLADAVRAFRLALEGDLRPGARVLNACAGRAWADAPVGEILKAWYGADADVAPFERPGHERDSVFAVDRIREELGFRA